MIKRFLLSLLLSLFLVGPALAVDGHRVIEGKMADSISSGEISLIDQTNWTYFMTIHNESGTTDYTSTRTLSFDLQDGDRRINLGGPLTVEDDSKIDQDLTKDASPIFLTVKLSDLGDGLIPYHIDDATGFGDSQVRIIIANGVQYVLFGVTEQDSVTDGETDGTTTISSDGAADDNFSSTCQVGDAVLVWGGTTTAAYGLYYIVTVTDNNNLVLNKAVSGTNSDVDFYVLRDGMIKGPAGLQIVGNTNDGTTDILNLRDSDETEVFAVNSDGDVEATSVATKSTSAPGISGIDSDHDPKISFKYYANASDTPSDHEYVDVTQQSLLDGSMTTWMFWDASEAAVKFPVGYDRHIDIIAGSATVGNTSPTPTTIEFARGLGFDADVELAFFNWEVPFCWDGVSDFEIQVIWFSTSGDAVQNGETVKLDLNYYSILEGAAIDNGTPAEATTTYTAPETQTDKELFETVITIDYDHADQPLTKGDTVTMQFNRDTGVDTYTGAVIVLRWEIKYNATGLPYQ